MSTTRAARGPVRDRDVRALVEALHAELPGFAVAYKEDSRLHRAIGLLVRPFNPHYGTQYTTVLFGKVWFPSRHWVRAVGARAIYLLLRHEAVHLRDARRWPLLFHLSYLLVLPVGVTARAFWEWRAYRETLRATWEVDGRIGDHLLRDIEDRFVGPDYLYMWPFRRHIRGVLSRERARIEGQAGG